MNIKQIIILVFIIILLAAAGVFGYKFLMSSATSSSRATDIEKNTKSEILPVSNQLNFEKVKKFNPTGKLHAYPSVTPADTGLQLNEIISQ